MNILKDAPGYFSASYSDARNKFRLACQQAGATITEYPHPLRGPEGEPLSTDVARIGSADAAKLLIVVSGTHGVEGRAGSGCQIGWLSTAALTRLPADTAVLLVHLINPWGCAWRRRQTEQNVDLNRHFRKLHGAVPRNELYEALHPAIASGSIEVRAKDDPAIQRFRAERGEAALANALFSGQYTHSDGVGFGGSHAGWSAQTLATIVETHAAAARHVAFIDIHSGLGPFGYGQLFCLHEPQSPAFRRARQWYGPGVVSPRMAESVPYELEGNMLAWIAEALEAHTTAIAVEFGTFEIERLLELQIDDCRLEMAAAQGTRTGKAVRDDLEGFFCPAHLDWRQSVAFRGVQVIELALAGLRNEEA